MKRPADASVVNVLLILNDAPYDTERSYNGLRLALALAKVEDTTVRVFLMADAVARRWRNSAGISGWLSVTPPRPPDVRSGGTSGAAPCP